MILSAKRQRYQIVVQFARFDERGCQASLDRTSEDGRPHTSISTNCTTTCYQTRLTAEAKKDLVKVAGANRREWKRIHI
jgi:hypothetical protein